MSAPVAAEAQYYLYKGWWYDSERCWSRFTLFFFAIASIQTL